MLINPISVLKKRLKAFIQSQVQDAAQSNRESIESLASIVVSTSTQLTAENLAIIETLNALQKRIEKLESQTES